MKTIGKLFEHMFWADRHLLQLLETSPAAANPEVLRLASHVIAAERVWLARVRGEDASALPIWPEWTLEELRRAAHDSRAEYESFLGDLTPSALDREVAYTNSSGVQFTTAMADILTHVALHGSYHRGQIASAARRAGGEPVNTDFITYVRADREAAEPEHPPASSRENEAERLAREFLARVWSSPSDLAAIDELMTDDYVITSAGAVVRGRSAFREWVHEFQRRLPGAATEVLEVFTSGDQTRVAARWICRGRSNGIFGLPPDGRPVEFTGIAIWRIREGRLAEGWVERSALEAVRGSA